MWACIFLRQRGRYIPGELGIRIVAGDVQATRVRAYDS